MSIDGINNNSNYDSNAENFEQFANRMNSTFPDRTNTIEEKKQAIKAKKAIMAHPDCPNDAKLNLQREINIIQNEINNMSSIFPNKNNLG